MASQTFESAWLARARQITPPLARPISDRQAVANDVDDDPYFHYHRMSKAALLQRGAPSPGRTYEDINLQRTPRKMMARRSTDHVQRLADLTAVSRLGCQNRRTGAA